MILTAGERAVWAAEFSKNLDSSGVALPSIQNFELCLDPSLGKAAHAACIAVLSARALEREWSKHFSGELRSLQMLRAMLGDEG